MKKIAETLPHNREEKVGYMSQLLLKKQSLNMNLKEEELGLPPKRKNNTKHMTCFKQNLVNYRDTKFNIKVELGDDGTYDIKGFGSASF